MSSLIPRRGLVALVAAISLVGAVAVVRAASAWTASSASLSVKPADAQVLANRLADEEARSASLRSQLDGVTAQAQQLVDALKAAQDKAKADAATAAGLAKQLAAAQAKLAGLQAQMAAAGAAPATATQVVTRPAPTPSGEPGDGGTGGDD